jgi:hypothetical protein
MKSSVFWVITLCSPLKADVSEEHSVLIFRAEKSKQEGGLKQVTSRVALFWSFA